MDSALWTFPPNIYLKRKTKNPVIGLPSAILTNIFILSPLAYQGKQSAKLVKGLIAKEVWRLCSIKHTFTGGKTCIPSMFLQTNLGATKYNVHENFLTRQ